MADVVVSVLLDNLVSLLVSEGHQLLEFNDEFEETKEELQYMQSYLKEADQVKRKDRNEILKRVMSSLRELVYDVEDIIADCQVLFQKKHQGCASDFMSYCSPTLLKTRRHLGKRLSKINKKIREVKERMKSYLDTTPRQTSKDEDGGSMPLIYPILMDEAEMVGLEDDSAKIRNWILEANEPLTVIGIVGMGGIGKTTLAEKIINNERKKNSFKHSIFVTVSQDFKFNELLKKMLKELHVDEKSLSGDDIRKLLEKLKMELDDKYLLVLDDIWGTDERMWWDSLRSALPQVTGSCVIVTTRNEEVAKSMGATDRHIHYPKILSDEDSWALFSKIVFARNGGKCTNPDLEGLGKEIVAGCGGLPLTIKVVGGMMLGKGDSIHEWRRISEHLNEELANSKKGELVISRLELSYEELPRHLQPCFLSLAMHPEDYEMSFRYIIELWIGEGFVWGRNGKTAFEIGEECLAELFNRFLIIGTDKNIFESGFHHYKMHDMIRDMVIKIAREESFFVSLDNGSMTGSIEQFRRLGISRNTTVEGIRNRSAKLRTLVGFNIERKEIIVNVKLCKLRWLRVVALDLSSTKIDEDVVDKDWLSGIGSLHHLVYLYIGNSSALRTFPDSIGNLRNLQRLWLTDCPNLERLPVSITTLEKLTAIRIFDCPSLECMPEGLGKLSNLEHLYWFRPVNKKGSGISELKKLKRLRELAIEIKSEEQIEEGEWNVLSMLHHLQILYLRFKGSSLDQRDGIVRKMDRHLSPPLKSVRELGLGDYPGERTPAWLSPTSLPNLQFLLIGGGRMRQMSPTFWESQSGVWKVEVLVLRRLKEMEEEWPRMLRAMPSLRLVRVLNCPKLKSFPFDVTVDDDGYSIWRKEEEEEEEGGALYAHSLLEAAPAREVEEVATEEEEALNARSLLEAAPTREVEAEEEGPEIQEISST